MITEARKLHFVGARFVLAFLALALGLVPAIPAAHAELLFSDSFAYPVGPLDGNGPPPKSPPGQGPWIQLGRMPQVTSPGLVFPAIRYAGNAVTLGDDGATGDTASATVRPTGVAGSGIAWISFLIRQDTITNPGFAVLTFNDGFGPTAPQIGVIYFSNSRIGIDNSVVPSMRKLSSVFASTATVRLVAKLDFTAGMEYLFINPPNKREPSNDQAQAQLAMTPEFKASGFDRVVLKSGYSSSAGAYTMDEVRVGTTFLDLRR